MPLLKPDVTESSAYVIPVGEYKARLVSHEAEISKKGNSMLHFTNIEVNVDGKIINREAWVVTSGKGAFNFVDLLRACHLNDEANAYAMGSTDEFNSDVLNGQEVLVVIDHEEYNGRPQDRIVRFLPL